MKKLEISCPRCGTSTWWQDNPSRPFCSEKCRLIDLGRWSSEDYAIQGDDVPQYDQDDEF